MKTPKSSATAHRRGDAGPYASERRAERCGEHHPLDAEVDHAAALHNELAFDGQEKWSRCDDREKQDAKHSSVSTTRR
ncbi:MAG TPA: hypothetical protein VGK31_04570 [Thermoanaerobaculia bacterium]